MLDTSVVVAAWRSRLGASFAVLARVGKGFFDVAVSVPLVIEYEASLRRYVGAGGLVQDDVDVFLDFICSAAHVQGIFFLWRPLLRDPKDDMVAELVVAASSDRIVTHNARDFTGIERFGVGVVTPAQFLKEIGEAK